MSRFLFTITLLFFILGVTAADTIYLSNLDLSSGESGWKKPQNNTNINGDSIRLNGISYSQGVGVHAHSRIPVYLGKSCSLFEATIGIDDRMSRNSIINPVYFVVYVDGKKAYQSKKRWANDLPEHISINIEGASIMELAVELAGNRSNGTWANWANAKIVKSPGFTPYVFNPYNGSASIAAKEITKANDSSRTIISYQPSLIPNINLPKHYGIGINKPFSFYIPVSGEKPVKVTVKNLPVDFRYDSQKQLISGIAKEAATYEILIEAENKAGKTTGTYSIIAGQGLALTPPMGWNSWNVFGPAITQELILETAHAIKESGLIDYGWSIVTIDDGWQGGRDTMTQKIMPNPMFPDIKALTDSLHELGLKSGIYSTPWVTSYMNLPGGSADTPEGKTFYSRQGFGVYSFHQQDATRFAAWGIDFLKYDWSKHHTPYAMAMQEALKQQNRDIILSISGALDIGEASLFTKNIELWRVNPDIEDNWESIYSRAFYHHKWEYFQKPGHWPDMDMLVVGVVGWGGNLHPSHLTPWEQVSHVSLWALFSNPLILGCDIRKLDAFTKALLTNEDIIAINQDILGLMPEYHKNFHAEGIHLMIKKMNNNSYAIGIFNTNSHPVTIQWSLNDILPSNKKTSTCKDVWLKENISLTELEKNTIVPHGCKVYIIK